MECVGGRKVATATLQLHIPDLVTGILGSGIAITTYANGGEVDIFEYLAGVSRDRGQPIVVTGRFGRESWAGREGLISPTHARTNLRKPHTLTHAIIKARNARSVLPKRPNSASRRRELSVTSQGQPHTNISL